MKVLYVEDDPEDLALFVECLEKISPSHELHAATNGKHALKVLENVRPDYIFLDINMPEMDGLQFLEAIKGKPDLKAIPVIVFTTSTSFKDKKESKRLGAYDFISKPSDFSDVCAALRKYL